MGIELIIAPNAFPQIIILWLVEEAGTKSAHNGSIILLLQYYWRMLDLSYLIPRALL